MALSTGLLTPWVGRDSELGTLASCWNQVRRGQGQVVLGVERLHQLLVASPGNGDGSPVAQLTGRSLHGTREVP